MLLKSLPTTLYATCALTRRDVILKYKGAHLGILWTILKPWIGVGAFVAVFAQLNRSQVGELPYPLFVFSGIIVWNFMTGSILDAGNSLWMNPTIWNRLQVPKIIFPLSSILFHLIEFALNAVILFLLCFYFGLLSPERFGWFLLFISTTLSLVVGSSLLLSLLNYFYKDIRFIVPFIFQVAILLTPVGYPVTFIAQPYRDFLTLNPFSAPVISFRYAMMGGSSTPDVLTPIIINITFLVISCWIFQRTVHLVEQK